MAPLEKWEMRMATTEPTQKSTMNQLAPYLGMGLQLTAAIVAFGALGWWLDGKWGTTPWLLIVGMVMGATGGMISLIRAAINAGSRKKNPENNSSVRNG